MYTSRKWKLGGNLRTVRIKLLYANYIVKWKPRFPFQADCHSAQQRKTRQFLKVNQRPFNHFTTRRLLIYSLCSLFQVIFFSATAN